MLDPPGLQMECRYAIAGMILTLALAALIIFAGARSKDS
jgi:hypothetical protein